MQTNQTKQKLQNGEVCIGHILMEFTSPGLMTVLQGVGLDFVLIDTEHTRFSLETVCELIRHARSVRLPAFVRVPRGQYDHMSRIMDAGADGIMAPNVETAEEAERIVQATKYAPLGKRGTAFGIAHDGYDADNMVQTMHDANAQSVVITQIESPQGVEQVDAILDIDGVDIAWIGHNDLSQAMGIPGRFEHPDFIEAVDRVLAECTHRGRAAGHAGGTPQAITDLIQRGFRCVSYGSDVRVYRQALLDGLAHIQQSPR